MRKWWRGEPATPTDIARKYEPRIDGVIPTRMFIIELHGEAVGLIQGYWHADPDWDRAVGINAAAGIDYLIGEVDQCGEGVGSAAIASFTPEIFARATVNLRLRLKLKQAMTALLFPPPSSVR